MSAEDLSPTRDPVFQINSCLWLVRKASQVGSGARPVYHSKGFDLRSLSRKLAFSHAGRQALQEIGLSAAPPEPDVVLRHLASGDHLVLECKAQSFSETSSTANQCRKLLIACSDPDASLGASGDAYLTYVLPDEDVELQQQTLKKITAELAEFEIEVAQSGTLGLSLTNEGLWAELRIDDLREGSSATPLCTKILAIEGTFEESRPLYLIPFDPAAENEQSPRERQYCARMLAERLFNESIRLIGRAELPACVRLPAGDLLSGATFGISAYWDAQELSKFKSRIARFIYRRLNRGNHRDKVELRGNVVVELDLTDESDRDAFISMLQKTNSEAFATSLLEVQHDAFEQDPPMSSVPEFE